MAGTFDVVMDIDYCQSWIVLFTARLDIVLFTAKLHLYCLGRDGLLAFNGGIMIDKILK